MLDTFSQADARECYHCYHSLKHIDNAAVERNNATNNAAVERKIENNIYFDTQYNNTSKDPTIVEPINNNR